MQVVCRDNEISIRYLEKNDKDIKCLYDWLNNEKVFEYYGDSNEKSLDFVKQKYENKIEDKIMFPCIIEFDKKNIGYIQFYYANSENYDLSQELFEKLADKNDRVFAIDVFIGEDDYRNRGIGTRAIKLLINTLFEKYDADIILIDPKTNNGRAISCYKKCGFIKSTETLK